MCKHCTVNSKGSAPGNSRVVNSLEPRREMPRPGSSFPSWFNYATAGGREGQGWGEHL